jgi:hypothetical protein
MKETTYLVSILSDMKKFLVILLFSLFSVSAFATNELDSVLRNYYVKNSVKGNAKITDEYTWIKRVYVDLAGRIPTYSEINTFIKDKDSQKKEKTVDKILASEDYVNNYYNFWADIFRIRPERLADDVALLKSYPYIDYVKSFVREDKSYKDFVYSLLSADGKFSDNGAAGYMLRDNGMPLDNLATSLQLFIGKDIACAQCHDDPFQDYTQMQFYQMASFFNSLDTRERRKEYGDVIKKIDGEIKEITKKDRIDNNVRQLIAANLFNLKDDNNKTLKLPHDYRYKDSKPFDVVEPNTLDGKFKNAKEDKRDVASKWIVEHEDFPNSVSNRIWGSVVGKALIIPEINFVIKDYPEGEVLTFLGNYFKEHNYSIKSLLRLISTSDFYSREAYTGKDESYAYQSVLVKRMSAYQIWDSILTLVVPDVNYSRVSFSEYSNLIEIDWKDINGKDLLQRIEDLRNYDRSINQNFLKYKNIDLVRASYLMNRNSFVGQFLKEYGSSDRVLIDSSNDKGSITQVLTIMNSPITELLMDKKSQIYQNFSKNQQKDSIFLSILSRPSKIGEKEILTKTQTNDLVWALINSREFLFRK